MISHILDEMFAWPQGIVVGNLIASFIIWFPHFVQVHIAHNKLHSRMESIERELNALRNQGSKG